MIVNKKTQEIFNNVACRIGYNTTSPEAYLFVEKECNENIVTGAEKGNTDASTNAAACTVYISSDINFYVVCLIIILATSTELIKLDN